MKRNRRFDLILALVIAVLLWMYVVGEMNPDTRRTFQNVQIKFTNEQALNDSGMAVKSYSAVKLSVTLVGRRNRLARLDDSDIRAVVDLSNAAAGKNDLVIELTTPNGTEVSRQNLRDVRVNVERLLTEQRKIRVSYLGDYASDQEPTTLSLDPETVTVYGAKSLVEKVSHVRANVKKSLVKEKKTTSTADLIPVDANGQEVKKVKLSQRTTEVTSILYPVKAVPLKLTVTGADSGDYKRTLDAPDTITVKGPASALEKTTKISAKKIDISDMTRSGTVKIEPILPAGILPVNNSEDIFLTVKVAPKDDQAEKKLTFSSSKIVTNDLADGLSAEIDAKTITVTLSGKESVLKEVNEEDVALSVALKGLKAGTHAVPLQVTVGVPGVAAELDPESVSVRLVKAVTG